MFILKRIDKGVNFMTPLEIIKEFYERGWVDDE